MYSLYSAQIIIQLLLFPKQNIRKLDEWGNAAPAIGDISYRPRAFTLAFIGRPKIVIQSGSAAGWGWCSTYSRKWELDQSITLNEIKGQIGPLSP